MTQMTTPPPEKTAIDGLLAGIRRRIYLVRLTERLVLALAWGGTVGACLTGARLLREGALRLDITQPGWGWVALLCALLPLGMAAWAYRKYVDLKKVPVNGVTTLTPALLLISLILTTVLSVASVVLIYLAIGGQIPVWTVPVAAIVPFVILAAASVRMIDERAAAIFVDQQVGLHERVSTALEMIHAPEHPATQSPFEAAFRAPVIASAIHACHQVRDELRSRSTRIGFHRLDQRAYAAAALAAIAAAGITFLTPLPAQARARVRQNPIAVSQARTLEQVMQELKKETPPGDKTTDKHLKPLEQAINQLQQGNMSPLEANAALSEAKEQMKRDQEAMAAADKVQAALRQMENTRGFAESADEMTKSQTGESQAEQGGGPQAGAEGLKNAAEGLASKMNGGMSEGERNNLANDLQNAANQAGADPQLKQSLQNAADAARTGDANKLSENMQAAGQRMGSQRAEQQMSQGAMQRAMNEIDRMQGQSGGQSTMVNQGGNPGQGGQQPNGGQGGQPGGQGNQGGGERQAASGSGGPQSGQNGPGQGGQQGSGGRQPGSGSTMMESPGGPGGENGPRGGLRSFVRIYDEKQTETSGTTEKLPSRINPLEGGAKGSMDIKGPADINDPAFKTYQDVLEDSRRRAMEELTRQEIPPQYQDIVKEFYKEPVRN